MNTWTDWGTDGPYCSSMACPRLKNQEMEDRVPAGELGTDQLNNYWCNHCWRQLELINWGLINHFPAVRVQGKMRYAIAAGWQSWDLSIVGANEDMVSALHETLVMERRAPLPLDGDNEGVERVKAWLSTVEKKEARKGRED